LLLSWIGGWAIVENFTVIEGIADILEIFLFGGVVSFFLGFFSVIVIPIVMGLVSSVFR
jgi:membrane-associated protease RseP (regulator of RpoE activity)